MSYNKKMFREMVEESKKKKVLPKPKDRIVDPMGQWAHPGQVTRIPSNRITMQGVPYPVLGVGNNGQQQMMYPGQEYSFPGSQYVDEYPLMQAQNGAIIDPGDDELAFQRFFKTLPFNLRVDNPSYNIRGYWNALGRPEKFDYSQPKEDDGMYHAFSRNPNTGEILKRPQHPTFKMAIEGDRAAGYYPIMTPEGKIKTVSGNDLKPGQSVFAMGGSLPGATGMMYARTTGAAPSEGPYAKKTLPSAQDGMTFYQHGLDWKPRNISRDGSSVNRADEYPLQKLDDLLNFTNYNKPKAKSGGWLDKYN